MTKIALMTIKSTRVSGSTVHHKPCRDWTVLNSISQPSDTILAFEGVANGGYGICNRYVAWPVKWSPPVSKLGAMNLWRHVFNPQWRRDDADPDGDGVPNLWGILRPNPSMQRWPAALLYIATSGFTPVVSSLWPTSQAMVWCGAGGVSGFTGTKWRIISGSEPGVKRGTRDQIFYGVEELVLDGSPYFIVCKSSCREWHLGELLFQQGLLEICNILFGIIR